MEMSYQTMVRYGGISSALLSEKKSNLINIQTVEFQLEK